MTGEEIKAALTGNSVAGVWGSTPYVSSFDASGTAGNGSSAGTTSSTTSCEGLSGSARQSCMQQQQSPTARTPGRSEDSASREGGRTPGRSEDSASRTGVPPGQRDSGTMGAPAAGGTPDSSSTGRSGGSMGGSSSGSSSGSMGGSSGSSSGGGMGGSSGGGK